MAKLNILNRKEIKKVLEIIKKQWDADVNLDYVFLMNDKGKIYLINKDIVKIDDSKLRIDSLGLYFGELKNNELRLSIEGSQIIGPKAKRNVVEINDGLLKLWIRGYDIEVKEKDNDFVIVKNKNDYIGCGRLKEGKILNHVPKTRRITSSD